MVSPQFVASLLKFPFVLFCAIFPPLVQAQATTQWIYNGTRGSDGYSYSPGFSTQIEAEQYTAEWAALPIYGVPPKPMIANFALYSAVHGANSSYWWYVHKDANFTLTPSPPGFNYVDCLSWVGVGATSFIDPSGLVAIVPPGFQFDVYIYYKNNCGTPNNLYGIVQYPSRHVLAQRIAGRYPIPGKNPGPPCPACGNPINPATGNKYQREVDYVNTSGPLQFVRHYNSVSTPRSRLGSNWRHTYDRSILTNTAGNIQFATVLRPDGKTVVHTVVGANWRSDADVTDRLTQLTDGAGTTTGWNFYVGATEDTETYDAQGRLTSIVSRAGVTQSLTYVAGVLSAVGDSFGHSVSFAYDPTGRLQTMTDPAGGQFHYAYDANNNLSSVTDPSGFGRTYLYDAYLGGSGGPPHGLTGLVDENSGRFATFAYDLSGQAISTEHAGGVNKYSISKTSTTSLITDPRMNVSTLTFDIWQGIPKNTTTTLPCVSGCTNMTQTYAYDANGNITQRTDFNGNITKYSSYDLVRNLELIRIEAFGSTSARTITTVWHPSYRLPATITELTSAGGRVTTFTYDTSGNLISKSVA